jgi:hypothetical protein
LSELTTTNFFLMACGKLYFVYKTVDTSAKI